MGAVSEEGQHGYHAPVVLVAGAETELDEDVRDVGLDRAVGEPEAPGDTDVRSSLGHESEDLPLPGGQGSQWVVGGDRGDEPHHDFGVQRGAAGGDPTQRVEEVVHVEHAVLQEVAEPAGADQADRVAGLDVLGKQHDAEVGVAVTQDPGGAGSIVGAVGRHPYVDDGKVGTVSVDLREQAGCVGRLSGDGVAGVDEQPGETFSEEGGVLADHDTHGRTASIVVPPPRGLVTVRSPPCAPTRSARPASPEPARLDAPPTPLSWTRTYSRLAVASTRRLMCLAAECFTALVTASAAT